VINQEKDKVKEIKKERSRSNSDEGLGVVRTNSTKNKYGDNESLDESSDDEEDRDKRRKTYSQGLNNNNSLTFDPRSRGRFGSKGGESSDDTTDDSNDVTVDSSDNDVEVSTDGYSKYV